MYYVFSTSFVWYLSSLSIAVRVRVRARDREWIFHLLSFFFPCLKVTNTFGLFSVRGYSDILG